MTMKDDKVKILVVEDDPAILEGLLDVLVFHGYGVRGEPDGGRGLEAALAGDHDLVILDVMLPTLDGFSICGQLRKKQPARPILMLTAKGAEDDVVRGFQMGADDYVTKPFSIRELVVRVEALLRRSGKRPEDRPLEVNGILFNGKTLQASRGGAVVEFTRREMDIIHYLHHHRERIVSKRDLLADVWKYADPDLETRTVDIHMAKLRKKLADLTNEDGDKALIRTIRGEGYRMVSE